MISRKLSRELLHDYAIQLAHVMDGVWLQEVGEKIHSEHRLTDSDREVLHNLYARAVQRLVKEQV